MFDEVTKRDAASRAARRARYLLGSTAAQAAAVAAAVLLCSHVHTRVAESPAVPVKIVRSTAPIATPAPSSQPRAGNAERWTPAREPPKPPIERPVSRRPPAPAVLPPALQPATAPPEVESSAPAPQEQAAPGEVDGNEQGRAAGDGHEGGGTPGAASSSFGPGAEEAPAFPGEGWRRPQQAQRDCVQNSVRVPVSLRGFVQGPITAKFAIGADGTPSGFTLLGDVPDARIRGAIWQAILSCKWIPGSDAQGRPAKLWVIMPIRFEAG